MASQSYALFKQALLAGTYNLSSASVKLCLVNIAGGHYSPNFTTDQFLSAIASGDRVAISAALTSVTITDGVLNAASTVFSAVPAGPAAGAFVIFIDTGTPATSPLIYYMDNANYAGLPVTPNGADINVTFPLGADKILALVG